ncbi:hypothetical protein Anas_10902 [Armadillidium nasatum]|uniref:CHK kinase-like domain-containing protein n=1 Tax=Armadillidium nasatum TaxID=96803 RepID=A0A5N5T784_9CRUS|nr:hypothetical protein Anas_10902 [Armadillidium nasatum]
MSSESSPSRDKSYTQDWLENILQCYYASQHPDACQDELQVIDWEIKPVEGEGYLSEMLALDVQYNVDKKEERVKLVAKLLPPDPYNRAFVIQTQFDLREIRFYTEVAPAFHDVTHRLLDKDFQPLPIPKHYHALYKEDAESILVMEDLRNKGYSHQNLNKGLTIRQAEVAVDCLAHIHSASIMYQRETKEELCKKFPYLLRREKAEEAFHALFEKGLLLLLKYLDKNQEYLTIKKCLQEYSGNRSKDIFERVLSPSDKMNTLVHCDFWSNNLMFKNEGNDTKCCVIDWQMIMQGKPTVDLGMLITTSLNPQIRRDHEDSIVNAYWNSLLKRLRKLGMKDKDITYTYDDLKLDLKDGKIFGALVMIGSVDIALGDPEREDRVMSLIRDLIADGSL